MRRPLTGPTPTRIAGWASGYHPPVTAGDPHGNPEAEAFEPASSRADAEPPAGFLSPRPSRTGFESAFVRLVATAGIIGIGTALGAGLGAWSDVATWIIALVVSAVSVVLAAILWRSRQL